MEAPTHVNMESIGTLAEFMNRYGFLIIFAASILLLLITAMGIYLHIITKKTTTELELAAKEKQATLDQNAAMFNLVTDVQTKQITQLEQISKLLSDISPIVSNTDLTIHSNAKDLEIIRSDINSIGNDNSKIQSLLNEILDYVKENEKYDREIIEKVSALESMLKILHKDELKQ